MNKYVYIISFLIIFSSCEKTAEYYFGLNMQPDFLADDFIPGLNIFGVIRTDSINNINGSFVHVQKVIRALDDTTSDLEIHNAEIYIYKLENGVAVDTFHFLNVNDTSGYRSYVPQDAFVPVQGQTYELKCTAQGLPELGAITIIPYQPEITNLSVLPVKIEFDIQADTTAFIYKIYLLNDDEIVYSNTLLPTSVVHTHVSVNIETANISQLIVYSYDENLAEYTANSNTEFNINKFRQYDNQVESGYGVFGSVNFRKIDIN